MKPTSSADNEIFSSNKSQPTRKPYEKPAEIYNEPLEVVAGLCGKTDSVLCQPPLTVMS